MQASLSTVGDASGRALLLAAWEPRAWPVAALALVLRAIQRLVAEEDDAVLGEGALHGIPLPVGHRLEVDAQHLGAAAAGDLAHLDRILGHFVSSCP